VKNSTSAAAAFLMACAGVWFFADALIWAEEQREIIRQSVIKETEIRIGQPGECSTTVNLSIWEEMNKLKVYRWVVECEDAK